MKKTISPAVVIAVVIVVVVVAVYLFARGARTQQVSTVDMGPAGRRGAEATGLAGSRMKPGTGRGRRGGRGGGGRAGR